MHLQQAKEWRQKPCAADVYSWNDSAFHADEELLVDSAVPKVLLMKICSWQAGNTCLGTGLSKKLATDILIKNQHVVLVNIQQNGLFRLNTTSIH